MSARAPAEKSCLTSSRGNSLTFGTGLRQPGAFPKRENRVIFYAASRLPIATYKAYARRVSLLAEKRRRNGRETTEKRQTQREKGGEIRETEEERQRDHVCVSIWANGRAHRRPVVTYPSVRCSDTGRPLRNRLAYAYRLGCCNPNFDSDLREIDAVARPDAFFPRWMIHRCSFLSSPRFYPTFVFCDVTLLRQNRCRFSPDSHG